MGIKHFFRWFKQNFRESIIPVGSKTVEIDNLMIDLNGLFHNSAQKVYKYGNHKSQQRLLSGKKSESIPLGYEPQASKDILVYKDICENIDTFFKLVKPKKRLLLCIDGPAPMAKQCQQRQRRFRAAMESEPKNGPNEGPPLGPSDQFDSNCISPGTKFMNELSKYITWFIQKRVSGDESYSKVNVIFSNEKSPGEGEHKLINYTRKYGKKTESWCIFSPDADLFMLTLGVHFPNFYILREEVPYTPSGMFVEKKMVTENFTFINIDSFREKLQFWMKWKDNQNVENTINDFILICFMVGNDFLPSVPSIEIMTSGIETMISFYVRACKETGLYLTKTQEKLFVGEEKSQKQVRIIRRTMSVFLKCIGDNEEKMFSEKYNNRGSYIFDPILEKYGKNVEGYKKEYNKKKLLVEEPEMSLSTICHEYFNGLTWVLEYYLFGTNNYHWKYPYHYAPFASDLKVYTPSFKRMLSSDNTDRILPFVQLMCILPSKSRNLLPYPLSKALEQDGKLKEFLPQKFVIDSSGKRADWEGIPIIPFIDYTKVLEEYDRHIKSVHPRDLERNTFSLNYSYTHNPNRRLTTKSVYGNFQNFVKSEIITL